MNEECENPVIVYDFFKDGIFCNTHGVSVKVVTVSWSPEKHTKGGYTIL